MEGEARERYGGCIGYIGLEGNMDWCIRIRRMRVKDESG
nr:chorismate-binding protein [Bacillus altitudinis]